MVLARLPPRVPSHHTGQSVRAFLAHLVLVAARPLGFAAGAAAFAAGALASERRSARRGGLARGLARGPLLCEEARLNITGQNSTFDTEIGFALIQARLAETSFFWPASVARKITPRSRNSGYGLLLGCRSGLDFGPFEKKK